MQRIVIFGNSGAGKTTLARQLAQSGALAHLDLDELAWLPAAGPGAVPQRRPLADSARDIAEFTSHNPAWVIEGCYADLLELVLPECSELIFLNPGLETCVANCRKRPWEPHKHASKAEQDANLEMLIQWVRAYDTRDDEFSLRAHRRLFKSFNGPKREVGAPGP